MSSKACWAVKALLPARQYELMHYSSPNYGLGWSNLEVNGTHISESDGTLGTFFSHVEILKEKNLAIVILCNSGDNGGKGAVINLARLFARALCNPVKFIVCCCCCCICISSRCRR